MPEQALVQHIVDADASPVREFASPWYPSQRNASLRMVVKGALLMLGAWALLPLLRAHVSVVLAGLWMLRDGTEICEQIAWVGAYLAATLRVYSTAVALAVDSCWLTSG